MAVVRMYCTDWWASRERAKKLLEQRGLDYEEIRLDAEPDFRRRLHLHRRLERCLQIVYRRHADRRLPASSGASIAKACSKRSQKRSLPDEVPYLFPRAVVLSGSGRGHGTRCRAVAGS